MNCYYHNSETAVAQCPACNRGLCNYCAKQYMTPICSTCNAKRINNEKRQIRRELFITYGVGVLLTFFAFNVGTGPYRPEQNYLLSGFSTLFVFYAYSGVVAGWQTLNRITPQIFLILPLIGWVIYFLVKITISMFVGLVMLPIRTNKNIKRLKELNSIST